jgi:DNA-binding CsgD family transcriptional regulator
LQDIKREIDELSRLGIEDKPQLADKLIDNHQVIFDRFPAFSETANLTEKRIFILSIDGYKPKEIANVVGVSVQYVHNVRTRLRKKLNLDNNVEWESLKKSHNGGGQDAHFTA